MEDDPDAKKKGGGDSIASRITLRRLSGMKFMLLGHLTMKMRRTTNKTHIRRPKALES